MAKLKQKGWRIPQELEQLIKDTKPSGMSESAYVTRVLSDALTATRETGNNGDGEAMAAIMEQLAVKDDQIASLGRALEAAQETARAAQALHAANVQRAALEDANRKQARGSRWERVVEAWRGR